MPRSIRGPVPARLAEFYARLNTDAIPPLDSDSSGESEEESPLAIPPASLHVKCNALVDHLKGVPHDRFEPALAELLRLEPEVFLVLSHIFRQKKFTPAELTTFMFDSSRTSDPEYFRGLEAVDTQFRGRAQKARRSDWIADCRTVAPELADLIAYKKSIHDYVGTERDAWSLWRSRIASSADVRSRIAQYVVVREHLQEVISSGAAREILDHSLRATSSEETKYNIGVLGETRVEEALTTAGLDRLACGHPSHSSLFGLERCASKFPGTPWFERQVAPHPDLDYRRKYDFVLGATGRSKFIVETNYFSTSGSKVDKTAKDFCALEAQLRPSCPLLYITDGPGWLGLQALLRTLFEVDSTRGPDIPPFIYNLAQFREELPRIIQRLVAN